MLSRGLAHRERLLNERAGSIPVSQTGAWVPLRAVRALGCGSSDVWVLGLDPGHRAAVWAQLLGALSWAALGSKGQVLRMESMLVSGGGMARGLPKETGLWAETALWGGSGPGFGAISGLGSSQAWGALSLPSGIFIIHSSNTGLPGGQALC